LQPLGLGTNSIAAGHGAATERAVSAQIWMQTTAGISLAATTHMHFCNAVSAGNYKRLAITLKEANPMSKLQQGPFLA